MSLHTVDDVREAIRQINRDLHDQNWTSRDWRSDALLFLLEQEAKRMEAAAEGADRRWAADLVTRIGLEAGLDD